MEKASRVGGVCLEKIRCVGSAYPEKASRVGASAWRKRSVTGAPAWRKRAMRKHRLVWDAYPSIPSIATNLVDEIDGYAPFFAASKTCRLKKTRSENIYW